MTEIREEDFIQAEDVRLKEFADYIRESRLSSYTIAKGCRIAWKTVVKALNGLPVRGSTESRIRFFIESNRKGGGNGADS